MAHRFIIITPEEYEDYKDFDGAVIIREKVIDEVETNQYLYEKNDMDNIDGKLLKKLAQPLHIGFIAKYILKKSEWETREYLIGFIEEGVIEESKYGKDYFVLIKN